MWLHTTLGFYSITLSPDHPGKVQVRARVKRDLENLLALLGETPPGSYNQADWQAMRCILCTMGRDYRWRILFPKVWTRKVVMELAGSIDYENFKDEIGRTPDQRNKLDDLHRVWSITRRWQDSEVVTMARGGQCVNTSPMQRYFDEKPKRSEPPKVKLSRAQQELLAKATKEWSRLPIGTGSTNMTLEALEKRGLVEVRLDRARQNGWQWRLKTAKP